MTAKLRSLPLLATLLSLAACERALDRGPGTAFLHGNSVRAGAVELVGAADLGAGVRTLVARLGGEREVRFVAPEEGGDARVPRVIVGTPQTEGLVERLREDVGVDFTGKGFALAGRDFLFPGCVVVATYEDPDRPGLPLNLVMVEDAGALSRFIPHFTPGWRPGASVYQMGELALEVPLTLAGRPLVADAEDRAPPWRGGVQFKSVTHEETGFVALVSRDLAPERVDDYLAKLARVRARVAAWAPLSETGPRAVVLAAHVEDVWASGAPDDLARANPVRGTVTALLAPGAPDDGGQHQARSLLREALGTPVAPWMLDGAAVDAADSWWGRPLEPWCAALMLGEQTPPLADLMDPTADARVSPHALMPMRGLLFRFMRTESDSGVEDLVGTWTGAASFDPDIGFERLFKDFMKSTLARHREAALAQRSTWVPEGESLRGSTLVQRFGDRARGFGSRPCAQSLEALAQLGAGAVALESHAAAGIGLAGSSGSYDGRAGFEPNRVGTLEGDAALAAALGAARSRGLVTMLRPNLISRPSGTWLAGAVITEEGDWRAFFGEYERLLVHYALLAELAGCDILCLGAGMSEATRTKARADDTEDERAAAIRRVKSDGWKRLVRRGRQAFGGALTYGALGAKEAGRIDFWTRLDYVGIDFRPFVGDAEVGGPAPDNATTARFVGLLSQAARIADDAGIPLFLTGGGFRSTERAWNGGIANGGPRDLLEQERLLRLFERALVTAKRRGEAPAGVLIGRWETDPSAGGPLDRGESLSGKPAAAELARLFSRR